MTDKFAPWVIVSILCIMAWVAGLQWVLGDSRQQCEQTASAETCAWTLR